LLAQEKVTKEKGTPEGAVGLAGILPATLAGFFLRVLAAPKGDPEDQKIGWALAHRSHIGGPRPTL